MSLDPEQLDTVRTFLASNGDFFNTVLRLRLSPFEFPGEQAPGKLVQATETKPRILWMRICVAAGLFFALAGIGWALVRGWQKPEKVTTSTARSITVSDLIGQLLSTPETLLHKIYHALPGICILLGLLALLAALFVWLLEAPAHLPDPLFNRLLAAKLRAERPPSSSFVQSLLADLRFQKIFDRAIFAVLPQNMTSVTEDTLALSSDWGSFIGRLVDTLDDFPPFVHFMENHKGVPLKELYTGGLQDLLLYGTRKLLFTEILGDPDCEPLYRDRSSLWRDMYDWISTLDAKKFANLLPKKENSSGSDKKSLILYALIAFLLLTLLPSLPWSACPRCQERKAGTDPVQVEVKLDADQLVKQLAALIKKLCPHCDAKGEHAETPHISISIPPSPPTSITIPPIRIPAKIQIELTSSATASDPSPKAEIQQNINLPPSAVPPTDRPPQPPNQQPPDTKPAMRGDTLVSFSRTQPVPAQEQQQAPPVADFMASFTLHSPSGKDCSYSASLPGTASKWPPDPVQMVLQSTITLPGDCPQIPASGTSVSVARVPLYNDLLQAYVSLEAKHSRHLGLFSRDQIIVLIHFATPKS